MCRSAQATLCQPANRCAAMPALQGFILGQAAGAGGDLAAVSDRRTSIGDRRYNLAARLNRDKFRRRYGRVGGGRQSLNDRPARERDPSHPRPRLGGRARLNMDQQDAQDRQRSEREKRWGKRVATVNAVLTVGFPRAEIQRGSFGCNPGKTMVRRQFKSPRLQHR
jgi:hypothetical protein